MLVVFVPFFLYVWNQKALEKSTNNRVASRFLARTPSMIHRIVRDLRGCGSISAESVLVSTKDFLYFGSDAIIYLSCNGSKGYASVVFSYS